MFAMFLQACACMHVKVPGFMSISAALLLIFEQETLLLLQPTQLSNVDQVA